ncbi:hypothetical protein [Candidatus Phytoplasma pini]|uniref:Uncharacterized protein n=1 Tax=Candidatus Phytoplasma pini TaxID=267362 RepID=A0A559KJW6_9MOLU|nr:hypothetical protein [Candidatus Phytoplasma pini]TVY12422.1 hypothetical protein MDPP_0038 [Candidatus Phytoplasma pini]
MLKNKIKKILLLLFLFLFLVLFSLKNQNINTILAIKEVVSPKDTEEDIEDVLARIKENPTIKDDVEKLITQIKDTKHKISIFFNVEKLNSIKNHISNTNGIKEKINEIFLKIDNSSLWKNQEEPFATIPIKIKDLKSKTNNNFENINDNDIDKLQCETTKFKDLNSILSNFYDIFKDNFNSLLNDDLIFIKNTNDSIADSTQKIDSKIFSDLQLLFDSTQQSILGANDLDKENSGQIQSSIKDITQKYIDIKSKIDTIPDTKSDDSATTSNNVTTGIIFIIILLLILIFFKKNKKYFPNNTKNKKRHY